MQVFISWSGKQAQELAELFRDWLQSVLQAVKPYFTAEDIDKGARWHTEISKSLEESRIGVLVLTRENLSRPWVMFEAGALSKSLDKARVCPILFGVETTDLAGPLASFQATKFDRKDFEKLIITMNNALGDQKLRDPVRQRVFNTFWPDFEKSAQAILERHSQDPSEKRELRSERDILEELLGLTRRIHVEQRGNRSPRGGVNLPTSVVGEIAVALASIHQAAQSGAGSEEILQPLKHAVMHLLPALDHGPRGLVSARIELESLSWESEPPPLDDSDIPF